MQKMGGTLDLVPQDQRGACFRIGLPLREQGTAAAATAATPS